jgi:hypothetical protein
MDDLPDMQKVLGVCGFAIVTLFPARVTRPEF